MFISKRVRGEDIEEKNQSKKSWTYLGSAWNENNKYKEKMDSLNNLT